MAGELEETSSPALPISSGAVLTTAQIATLLQISQRTVQRAIREQQLKAHRVGRIYRVHAQDLQDWWATMRIAPNEP
jgi:excisionase family DNA binding protein